MSISRLDWIGPSLSLPRTSQTVPVAWSRRSFPSPTTKSICAPNANNRRSRGEGFVTLGRRKARGQIAFGQLLPRTGDWQGEGAEIILGHMRDLRHLHLLPSEELEHDHFQRTGMERADGGFERALLKKRTGFAIRQHHSGPMSVTSKGMTLRQSAQ